MGSQGCWILYILTLGLYNSAMVSWETKKRLPYVAAAIVLRPIRELTHVLLSPRTDPDFRGKYFPPGGFVDIEESIAEGAKRELTEETGLRPKRTDFYPYRSDLYSMHLYKPDSAIAFAQIFPFHFVVWNKKMGVPANNSGSHGRWEWIPLYQVYSARGRDARFPGNISAMMIHALSVIREDESGWFKKRGIRG